MTKTRPSFLKSRNFGALLAQRFRDISIWKSVFRNFAGVDDRRGRYAGRTLWFVTRVSAVPCMVFLMWSIMSEYKMSPTVTTPETKPYPMRKISYPAIAICNVNRIGRRATLELAAEILGFESTLFTANLTLPELTRMLNLLGQLYLYQINESDGEATKLLHTILERGYNGYKVDRIMKREFPKPKRTQTKGRNVLLSPKCRSMLLKCSWEGKDQACEDIFLLRKTQDGYCCTFNYARRNVGFGSAQNDVFASQHIERSTTIGSEYGLSVLLNPQLDDHAYRIFPINGFKVFVYNPLDYPDASSGNLRQVLISPRTETYINLGATIFYTTKDVQSYDLRERDCLFRTEQSKIFHGYYSFSDCILHCRIRDIFQLCNCMPFFYPIAENLGNAVRICNLKDLSCLKKYRVRWRNVKPRFEQFMVPFDESAFEETSGYLSCDCFPSCDDVTYSLQFSSIPLSLSELSWGRNKYLVKNHSVVQVYFGKNEAIRLRQDVLFYWYEFMSNYGGVCSLILGISIINVIEVLYRLIVLVSGSGLPTTGQTTAATRMLQDELEKSRESAKETSAIATISEAVPPLHWREIISAVPKKQFDPSNLSPNALLKQ